jgi:hypothetical protein
MPGQQVKFFNMAVNPTVILTFFLLVLMVGAGLTSGTWGYSLGRQALRGITQPDSSPSKQIGRSGSSSEASETKGMQFLDEAELIDTVKARMSGKAESEPAEPSPSPVSSAPPSSIEATPVVDYAGTAPPAVEPVAASNEVQDAVTEEAMTADDSATSWTSSEETPVDSELDVQADPFEAEPFLEIDSDQSASP